MAKRVPRVAPSLGDPLVSLQSEEELSTSDLHHIFRDVDSLEACLLEDLSQRCEEAIENGMDIEVIRLALRQYAASITLMILKD